MVRQYFATYLVPPQVPSYQPVDSPVRPRFYLLALCNYRDTGSHYQASLAVALHGPKPSMARLATSRSSNNKPKTRNIYHHGLCMLNIDIPCINTRSTLNSYPYARECRFFVLCATDLATDLRQGLRPSNICPTLLCCNEYPPNLPHMTLRTDVVAPTTRPLHCQTDR